jgi:hypothetical protein
MATQLEVVNASIAEFAAKHTNGFTVADLATHYNLPEKLAKRIVGEVDGLVSTKVGDVRLYSFVASSKPKRNIKTSTDERRTKVVAYFKAACYNASKVGMNRDDLRAELEAMMKEYDVETSADDLNITSGVEAEELVAA